MNGTLITVDVFNAPDSALLDNPPNLVRLVETACARGGATVINISQYRFHPHGVTILALLAESHAAVHTWPESAGYTVDVFTCGQKANPYKIARGIANRLGGTATLRKLERGNGKETGH